MGTKSAGFFPSKKWCADANLAMAIKQIAADEGISQEDALSNFKETCVYRALYDFETGLWGVGPANLIYLYNKHKEDHLTDQGRGTVQ